MDQEGKLIEEFRLKERYVQFIGLWKDNFILTKYIWPDMEEGAGKVFEIPGKILFFSKKGDIMNECSSIPIKAFLHPNISVTLPVLDTQISEDGNISIVKYRVLENSPVAR